MVESNDLTEGVLRLCDQLRRQVQLYLCNTRRYSCSIVTLMQPPLGARHARIGDTPRPALELHRRPGCTGLTVCHYVTIPNLICIWFGMACSTVRSVRSDNVEMQVDLADGSYLLQSGSKLAIVQPLP